MGFDFPLLFNLEKITQFMYKENKHNKKNKLRERLTLSYNYYELLNESIVWLFKNQNPYIVQMCPSMQEPGLIRVTPMCMLTSHRMTTGLARHAVISFFSRSPRGQGINATQVNLPWTDQPAGLVQWLQVDYPQGSSPSPPRTLQLVC